MIKILTGERKEPSTAFRAWRRVFRIGRAPLRPLGGCWLLLFLLARIAAAEAASLEISYQIAWGHISLGEAHLRLAETGRHYRLDGEGWTEGAIGLLFDWRGEAQTQGVRDAEGRRPLLHRHEGAWNGAHRVTQVRWGSPEAPFDPPFDLPQSEARPPPDLAEVTPIPPGATEGTVDPFSALIGLLDGLEAGAPCESRARVWDGRRRYDLEVTAVAREPLTADRPWSYNGPALKCRLTQVRIGGFRRQSPWRRDDDRGERAIWVARVPLEDAGASGAPVTRYLPVRAEVETTLGRIVARLRVRG